MAFKAMATAKEEAPPVIDLSRLLDATIFNYLVGNNDATARTSPCFTGHRNGRYPSQFVAAV